LLTGRPSGLLAVSVLFDVFCPVGSSGFVIANATAGVESSGECDGAAAGGFAVFGADVSLTRPGDKNPLDVPDDQGIRQRRRPNTVPEPSPAGQLGRLIALPSLLFATDAH
jgi:hypothetical protein